jgi:hypothetical protein
MWVRPTRRRHGIRDAGVGRVEIDYLRFLVNRVAGHQVAIVWNMVCEQLGQALHTVAPVAVQFTGNTEPARELNACQLDDPPAKGRHRSCRDVDRAWTLKTPETSGDGNMAMRKSAAQQRRRP